MFGIKEINLSCLAGICGSIQIVFLLWGGARKWGRDTHSTQPCYLRENEGEIPRIRTTTGRPWFDLHPKIGRPGRSFICPWAWLEVHLPHGWQNHRREEVCGSVHDFTAITLFDWLLISIFKTAINVFAGLLRWEPSWNGQSRGSIR